MYFDADALVVNSRNLRLVIEPGSNEGSYIMLYEGACWIMGWRYACLRPNSREIKQACKKVASALRIDNVNLNPADSGEYKRAQILESTYSI